MPVASNTTTGVPVGTTAVKVEVAELSAEVLDVFVEGAGVAEGEGPVGAALVSVDTAVAAGEEVSVGATEVSVEGGGVAGAEVPAGGALVSVEAAEVAGADVPAGGLEVVDGEVLPDVSDVFEAGGEVGAAGVLSSASAPKGLTALTTNTNKTAAVKK